MKKFLISAVLFLFSTFAFCVKPKDLKFLIKAYPDISFESSYDSEYDDYLIKVTLGERSKEFYWAEGKMLPKEELKNKDDYLPILYYYPKKIPNPKDFTQEDIKKIKEYANEENRKNSPDVAFFFYDFIYDCSSRIRVEQHIKKTTFLGFRTNVHDRIIEPLKRVETEILKLAKKDKEVQVFIDELTSIESYNWREILDSKKKSIHSYGIATDVLPTNFRKRNIYWVWRKDYDPNKWMLVPLEDRWIVPEKVIKIFESEGFIYGGKWIVWDNMHFEYFPEIILYNK